MCERTSDISLKIGISIVKTPFKYISDYNHSYICQNIGQWNSRFYDAIFNCPF